MKWRYVVAVFGAALSFALPAYAQSATAPTSAQSPPVLTYHAPNLSGGVDVLQLDGSPTDLVRLMYGSELTVSANHVTLDRPRLQLQASGATTVTDLTASIRADSLYYSAVTQTGKATNAVLQRPPLVIQARTISAIPGQIIADDAIFKTVPLGVAPGYSLRARRLILRPSDQSGEAQEGSLYVFGTKIATLRRYHFSYAAGGGPGSRPQFRPSFGYSSRYGTFVTLDAPAGLLIPVETYLLIPTRSSVQGRLLAGQAISLGRHHRPGNGIVVNGEPGKPDDGPPEAPNETPGITSLSSSGAGATTDESGTGPASVLATIHRYAVGNSKLPDGDPLLFHQFMPWPLTVKPLDPHSPSGLATSEEASFHIAGSGRDLTNLFVSRLPEVHLTGVLALNRVTPMPDAGDPLQFRRYLRNAVFYAAGSAGYGRYYEQPSNIRATRAQYSGWLTTSPVLVAANTVIVPRLITVVSHYNGSLTSYRYNQASLSLMRYVTDRTAFGFDYFVSDVHGNSPFNFDVLDSTQEIDARAQAGNHNVVVGGVIRYAIDGDHVIDYKATIAPTVRGIIPVLTYDYQNRSIGLGLAFDSVSF